MQKSAIAGTESTGNPTIGCTKVSSGCKFCYAEIMAKRLQAMKMKGYEEGFKFKILPERLTQPLKTRKPTLIFVNSMSDMFHEEMPFDFLDKIFQIIAQTPQHRYQILTKRPHIMQKYCANKILPNNAWMGVTVENTSTKDRIDMLRNINAKLRFLSIEPLLEDVGELDLNGIHWAVVAGESGVNARQMQAEGVVNIQKQCAEQQVAFYFKQGGNGGEDGIKRGNKLNGCKLLGKEWKEMPNIEILN